MRTTPTRVGAALLTMAGATSATAQVAYTQCVEQARTYKAKDLTRCAGQSGQGLRDCQTRADELYKKRMGDCDLNETRRLETENLRAKQRLDTERQRRIDAARRAGQPLPN